MLKDGGRCMLCSGSGRIDRDTYNQVFGNKKPNPPTLPVSRARRQAILLGKDSPPIVVDPKKITHAFIEVTPDVATPSDKGSDKSSKILDAVFELNKKRNPKLWLVALGTGAANTVKYTWLTGDADKDGYPYFDPESTFRALQKLGLDSSASLVITKMQATLDGGRSTSKVYVGFGFLEEESRFLCPDYDNKCIPPPGIIVVETEPGQKPKIY